jgi:hypothetical protein
MTTAIVQGVDSYFSTVKPNAREHRSVDYVAAMLYSVEEKLAISCYWYSENIKKIAIKYIIKFKC